MEKRCDALAAADAHGLETELRLAALHLVQQRREDAHAGRADRMAERNAGAVDVQLVALVPAPAFEHAQDLRGERFVELDEVDVSPAGLRAREKLCDGGDGAEAHRRRVTTGRGPASED